MRNPVFRLVEGRARGVFPFLGFEVLLAVLPAAVLLWLDSPFIATMVCGGILASLMVWRMMDNDRSDYMEIFLRRHLTTRRAYSLAQPDTRYRPFPHR